MYTKIERGSQSLRLNRSAAPALITAACCGRERLFADPESATTVIESLRWLDAHQRLILYAAVVMPDHVHFVADPLGTDWRLLLRSMKSFTAHQITKRLHRHGAVWQSQYHDHRISTDAQLLAAIQYCLLNPVRAGLVAEARDWPFSWCRFEV